MESFFYLIGKIIRHNLDNRTITLNLKEELELKGKSLFVKMSGNFIPFLVMDYIYRSKKSVNIVLSNTILKEIINQTYGCNVYLKEKKESFSQSKQNDDYDNLIGLRVYSIDEKEKELGIVKAILNRDLQALMEVYNYDSKSNFLVPINTNLIPIIDYKNKKIFLSLPCGIINLNKD